MSLRCFPAQKDDLCTQLGKPHCDEVKAIHVLSIGMNAITRRKSNYKFCQDCWNDFIECAPRQNFSADLAHEKMFRVVLKQVNYIGIDVTAKTIEDAGQAGIETFEASLDPDDYTITEDTLEIDSISEIKEL